MACYGENREIIQRQRKNGAPACSSVSGRRGLQRPRMPGLGSGARDGAARRPSSSLAPCRSGQRQPNRTPCVRLRCARSLVVFFRPCVHTCDAHCSQLTSLLPLHGTQQPALRGPDGAGAVSTPYALIRWAEQEQEISCACAGGIDFVVIVLFF